MFPIEYVVIDETKGLIRCGDSELTVDFRPPVPWETGGRSGLSMPLLYLNFEGRSVNHQYTKSPLIKEAMAELDLRDLFDKVLRDKAGRQINTGDYIVYPTVSASTGFLKFGRVIELRPAIENEGRNKLVVMGEYSWHSQTSTLQKKPSTLQHPSRTLVIDMRSLPIEMFKSMDAIEIGPPKIRKKKW